MAECTCARSARAWANVTCQCGGGRLHGGVTDIGEARWRGRSTGEYYFVYYGPGDFEEVETLYVLRMRQRYLELRAENLHQCMDVIGERLLSEDLAAEQLAPVPQSWPVSKGRWARLANWVQSRTSTRILKF